MDSVPRYFIGPASRCWIESLLSTRTQSLCAANEMQVHVAEARREPVVKLGASDASRERDVADRHEQVRDARLSGGRDKLVVEPSGPEDEEVRPEVRRGVDPLAQVASGIEGQTLRHGGRRHDRDQVSVDPTRERRRATYGDATCRKPVHVHGHAIRHQPK